MPIEVPSVPVAGLSMEAEEATWEAVLREESAVEDQQVVVEGTEEVAVVAAVAATTRHTQRSQSSTMLAFASGGPSEVKNLRNSNSAMPVAVRSPSV